MRRKVKTSCSIVAFAIELASTEQSFFDISALGERVPRDSNIKIPRQVVDTVTTYTRLEPSLQEELQRIVEALSAPGKGILDIDESPSSFDSRFRDINLDNTEYTRRDYREMLVSARGEVEIKV